MSILTIDDFESGKYKIPLDVKQEIDFQNYIDCVECEILPQLFGVELYELFKADFDIIGTEPTDQRFKDVFDKFNKQNDCNIIQSEGIKEMLRGFIYFSYVRDLQTRLTTVGMTKTKHENSTWTDAVMHDLIERYNNAIGSYQAIQYFMCNMESSVYPEFKGVRKAYNHTF